MSKLLPVFLLVLIGCQSEPASNVDPDRILSMAGEEAGQITSAKDRLARQLNIANRQNETHRQAAARATLAAARSTIEHADKPALTDHERLAGWISLSELARAADDNAFANAALDQALTHLNEVTPLEARCQYVPGVERELRALRGDRAAVQLLTTASDWAMDIPKQPVRRAAYTTYAAELFRCNDYDAARATLRHDPDPAWRADAMTTLSDRLRAERGSGFPWSGSPTFYADSAVAGKGLESTGESSSFGLPLDFRSNFQRK
jgi:hypothetical protein